MNRFCIVLIYAVFLSFCAYGQDRRPSHDINIRFRFDRSELDSAYMDNPGALRCLDSLLGAWTPDEIDSIVVVSTSSPEGLGAHNRKLSARRAASMLDYLYRKHAAFTMKIYSSQKAESWDQLQICIVEDPRLSAEEKESLLSVIRSEVDVRQKKAVLSAHRLYPYIYRTYYPLLRRSSVKIFRAGFPGRDSVAVQPAPVTGTPRPVAESAGAPEVLDGDRDAVSVAKEEVAAAVPVAKNGKDDGADDRRVPILSFRTNLLLPAMNAGIEIPVRTRWSVGADWYWPWFWPDGSNDKCYELLGGFVYGRYWLGGDRTEYDRLTGHSIGLYVNAGYYDLEKDYRGMQGEFYGVGIDYRYSLPLGRRRRVLLDFSLGIGYLYSTGKTYDVPYPGGALIPDGQVKTVHFFGPTRAEISLVFPLYRKEVRK